MSLQLVIVVQCPGAEACCVAYRSPHNLDSGPKAWGCIAVHHCVPHGTFSLGDVAPADASWACMPGPTHGLAGVISFKLLQARTPVAQIGRDGCWMDSAVRCKKLAINLRKELLSEARGPKY